MRIPLLVLVAVAAVALWWLAWPLLAAVAVVVFGIAVTAFVVRFLGSAWRVFTASRTDGPSAVRLPAVEPAFRRYLVGQVWRDLGVVLTDTLRAATRPVLLLSAGATQILVGGWQAIALAPVWLASVVGLLAAAAGCAMVVLLVSGGYTVLTGLSTGLQLAGVAVVRGLDGVLVSVRRTRPACPHPGCYRPFSRPGYACPGCAARHHDLVPGRYGVLRRVCRCGGSLPTSVLLGRGRLAATCPHCGRPLAGSIGHAPLVHLPVVGGPAAGKSTYTHLAVGALVGGQGQVRFADEKEAAGFAERLDALRNGAPVPRTLEELVRATVLDVALPEQGRCLLYLFDPPGEHYTTTDRVAWQRYLDLAAGLLVVVDPLSLEGVRRSLTPGESQRLAGVTPSQEDPAHVIDRVVGALRTRPDGGRLERVAVVVTKTDALRRTSVGQPLGNGFGPGAETADQVRDWLNWVGWGNPMRTLDRVAGQVRYFASGLDVPPDRIVEPVRWLAAGAGNGRRRLPAPDPDSVPRLPATRALAADQVPTHYRIFRYGLLAALWLLTVAAVTGLLSGVAVTGWQLLR
ncbi:MAG: TRAFAC clade GTPase domain-containing protein [Micromonosporaceae bacterium]